MTHIQPMLACCCAIMMTITATTSRADNVQAQADWTSHPTWGDSEDAWTEERNPEAPLAEAEASATWDPLGPTGASSSPPPAAASKAGGPGTPGPEKSRQGVATWRRVLGTMTAGTWTATVLALANGGWALAVMPAWAVTGVLGHLGAALSLVLMVQAGFSATSGMRVDAAMYGFAAAATFIGLLAVLAAPVAISAPPAVAASVLAALSADLGLRLQGLGVHPGKLFGAAVLAGLGVMTGHAAALAGFAFAHASSLLIGAAVLYAVERNGSRIPNRALDVWVNFCVLPTGASMALLPLLPTLGGALLAGAATSATVATSEDLE